MCKELSKGPINFVFSSGLTQLGPKMSQWFCGNKLGGFVLLQEGSSTNVCAACLLQNIQECLVCKIFISSILFPSYEFHVKPRNPLGEGPSSNVVSFSTESGKNFQRSAELPSFLQL